MKKINLQTNYSINGSYLQLCLPFEIEYLIPVDESVRLLDQVLEVLDYRKLYLTYSVKGRNPSVEPKTLFKIIVYAYSQGIYSSRDIERACKFNLTFIFLLQGQKAPDNNTISRFRRNHLSLCIEDLFTQLINVLAELDEIHFQNLFIDGTKIEADANKYTFVWKKAVAKNEAKLQKDARNFLTEEVSVAVVPEHISSQFLGRELNRLYNQAKRNHVTFVYGSGLRKTELQRKIEKLTDYYERQSR